MNVHTAASIVRRYLDNCELSNPTTAWWAKVDPPGEGSAILVKIRKWKSSPIMEEELKHLSEQHGFKVSFEQRLQ